MSKRVVQWMLISILSVIAVATVISSNGEPVVVTSVVNTEPLFNYEDAPATPDADDPAIWFNRSVPGRSLVIGTAKDAGLLVYNLSGQLVQALLPPNAPHIAPEDPPTPAGINPMPGNPCRDSITGETFGRFNNVDIAYGVRLGVGANAPRADVAIVSDRGCDRVRFYRIDPSNPDGPLSDITAADVPRVFPARYEQPSPLQPSGAVEGWRDNPVDDQNTVYGLTVAQGQANELFVTQRERGLVRQLEIVATSAGTLSYRLTRTFLFRTSFTLRDEHRMAYEWTPCREAAIEEPQAEGLVFDTTNRTLYVGFETIGLYQLPLRPSTPAFVVVEADDLIEPITSFGQAYRAIPDEDEFECEYAPAVIEPGDIEARGSAANAGQYLAADLEGLTIMTSARDRTVLLASSQGDSSFHFYELARGRAMHRGVFFVDGVGDTDGVHYFAAPIAPQYPLGLLVVQNGAAPEPPDSDPVNGYEFDGATQFMYVDFREALAALGATP